MPRAIDVARFLVHLAANDEEPDYLTHLRLQKLLYYSQAWSLVQRRKPMFDEKIRASANGPVVREVYSVFESMGRGPILPEQIGDDELLLETDDREFLASVWEAYKGFSPWRLREMTHQEAPWLNARRGYAPTERSDAEITPESLVEYFSGAPSM